MKAPMSWDQAFALTTVIATTAEDALPMATAENVCTWLSSTPPSMMLLIALLATIPV